VDEEIAAKQESFNFSELNQCAVNAVPEEFKQEIQSNNEKFYLELQNFKLVKNFQAMIDRYQ